MDLLAIIRIAMRALSRNKMRSVLTMLGIIIGVGAVIAMLGVGQGARQTMQEQIQAMGSNLSILLLPALPIATTQINAPTPTEMPTIVRTLLTQLHLGR